MLFAVAFILTAHLGMAQDAAFTNDVKKLLDLSGGNAQIEMAKKQVIAMVPADKQAAFSKDFEESLKPLLKVQQEFYTKEFTHDDIKQLIKFYESPVGKKMADKSAKLAEATMPAIQSWSMELQSIIMKYQD